MVNILSKLSSDNIMATNECALEANTTQQSWDVCKAEKQGIKPNNSHAEIMNKREHQALDIIDSVGKKKFSDKSLCKPKSLGPITEFTIVNLWFVLCMGCVCVFFWKRILVFW